MISKQCNSSSSLHLLTGRTDRKDTLTHDAWRCILQPPSPPRQSTLVDYMFCLPSDTGSGSVTAWHSMYTALYSGSVLEEGSTYVPGVELKRGPARLTWAIGQPPRMCEAGLTICEQSLRKCEYTLSWYEIVKYMFFLRLP